MTQAGAPNDPLAILYRQNFAIAATERELREYKPSFVTLIAADFALAKGRD